MAFFSLWIPLILMCKLQVAEQGNGRTISGEWTSSVSQQIPHAVPCPKRGPGWLVTLSGFQGTDDRGAWGPLTCRWQCPKSTFSCLQSELGLPLEAIIQMVTRYPGESTRATLSHNVVQLYMCLGDDSIPEDICPSPVPATSHICCSPPSSWNTAFRLIPFSVQSPCLLAVLMCWPSI